MSRHVTKKYFSSFFKGWGGSCESECPKPENQKYVIQKSCGPSIFESWKPKIPELKSASTEDEKNVKDIKEKCWAGMQVSKPTRCLTDAEARECQKRNHPKWLAFCPPLSKTTVNAPMPPMIDAKVTCKTKKGKLEKKQPPKMKRKKCQPKIPTPDWDHDGILM